VSGHYTQQIPDVETTYGSYHGFVRGLARHVDPDDFNAINPWEMRRLAVVIGFVKVEAFGFLSRRTILHRAVYHFLRKGLFLLVSPCTLLVARKAL
jgi:hypothetical protein